MKIKLKLVLGVGFLFVLIVLLTVVSTGYINALKRDTNNILKANYNTLEYSRNMILALDKLNSDPEAVRRFEINLQKQRKNETEPGEKMATETVAKHFSELKVHPGNEVIQRAIRADISELMRLNMTAIEKKSEIAGETAETAVLWIAITGTFCFLVAFILLFNLPGSIANPIKELTESIKEIAAQNYTRRVHLEGHGEFGELAKSFNTMAEKLEEYAGSRIAALLMEKKRIDTLINNMRDPVIGLDEDGKILFANDEILRVAGLSMKEVIGKNASEVGIHNELIKVLAQPADIERENRDTKQLMSIYADDKESYFEREVVKISVLPTGEKERIDIGKVIILKNVTPFKELDFAKTNFIATVSHELKTPISSIQMSLQLLMHLTTGKLNKAQSQLIESIEEDSARLLKITGELLNVTQAETGNIQLNMHPNDAYFIIQYAINATKVQAEQRKIVVSIDTDENVPNIRMDAEKTTWVLTNFMTNAIRYSPEKGEIIVSLKIKEDQVFYAVQDFGSGIEKEYEEKIFQRYFQVPGSSTSGTGLGLAISKGFIEGQGGSIGVETNLGTGSTFFISFPI